MKTKLLGLMSFILLLMGCTSVTYRPVVMDAVAPDPAYYSVMVPLEQQEGADENSNCSVSSFLFSKAGIYDAIIGLRVEEREEKTQFLSFVISRQVTCSYRAVGVKYARH